VLDNGGLKDILDVTGDTPMVRQGQITEVGGEEIELVVGEGVGGLEHVPEGGEGWREKGREERKVSKIVDGQ